VNITEYVKVALFATSIANFSKLWHDGNLDTKFVINTQKL